ncbi:MAG: hypothetical protein L3K15_01900 [Thermoplasmata archaeon]|nr:hypothetical protein [Thermoplasmata archaeon]
MTLGVDRARKWRGAALAVLALLLLPVLALVAAHPAAAASSTTPLTGAITGPTTLGQGLKAKYVVTATGGPAFAANGTQSGVLSYHAYFIATNTTSSVLAPPSGVLVNGTITLGFTAPNITESATISVVVTSTLGTKNESTNLTLALTIVAPLRLSGTLVVSGAGGVSPFGLTVTLDGSPVGTVAVPGLAAGASYPISFSFVPPALAPGWHTLAVALGLEHGLVSFAGGAESISHAFYIAGPAPNYTAYYVAGFAAFIGAIVIWTSRVGARRRGRPRT